MSIQQGLQFYNQKFIEVSEHFSEFIQARVMKQPNIWHDRIPRGAYKLFNGIEQKSNIFRGGLPVPEGLASWREVGKSRKPTETEIGFDNCNPGTPHTYTYAWETIQFSGYQDEWQSEPLCINDLKFVDYAKEQVGLVVKTGVDYGISMLENWNREMYVYQAILSKRGMVMATGALDFENAADDHYRFDYDPFATTTDVDGASVPYITFDADLDISTLNWDFLDYIRTSLAERAGEAAVGNEAGMPVFGLMLDLMDFEKMIKSDPALREDWRQAMPQKLIEGYGMGLKTYRGFALMHDARQMRFRVKSVGADGKVVATRVSPLKLGRVVTIGREPIPNPDYYRAEIGIGVIFMNDVLQNLFVPSVDNLGSGVVFGPAPGLTGEWQWINIKDPVSNILGESGYFYGRFQIFPKPLVHAFDCTVFAYRRCAHALSTNCAIETRADVGTGAVALSAAAASADFDDANNRVTVSLAALLAAGVGDPVTVKKADANSFTGYILSDAQAPKYVIGWKEGATHQPTAYTDFTTASTVTA